MSPERERRTRLDAHLTLFVLLPLPLTTFDDLQRPCNDLQRPFYEMFTILLLSALFCSPTQALAFPRPTAAPLALNRYSQPSPLLNITSAGLVKKGYEVGDQPYFPSEIPSCGGEWRP